MNISPNIGGVQLAWANTRGEQTGSTRQIPGAPESVSRTPAAGAIVECQTCKNRTYVDGSNDASVSFKTPTKIAPGASFSAVRSHEQEHVVNESAKAQQNGGQVVSQNVVIRYAMCPECGRSYASGGTTTTVVKYGSNSNTTRDQQSGVFAGAGQIVDARA